MKSYKYVKRKLLKLQKTNSRVDAFLSGWFFKLIFCLIILLGYLAMVEYAMPNFENSIKGNESWAIALIALPIALFGIYISVLLPLLREMNAKVLGITIREIHKSIPRIVDYRGEALIFVFLNTSMWIYNFILQDYRNMIAIAIYLSLCFIYLIIYAIWLYSLDPIDYYCESKIRLRIKKLDITKALENTSQTTISSVCEEQIAKVNNYIATTYVNELKTIDILFLEAIDKENTEQAKHVLSYILNKSKNSRFSELNVIITNKIVQRCLDLSDELIKREDFLFLFNLTSSIMCVLDNNLVCAMENLKNYIYFIRKNVILIGNNLLEFIRDCQPLLLKHLFYYDMLSNTSKQLADILTKLKSIDNSLIFFDSYNIKSTALGNNEILLKQYNEIIKALTDFPHEIDKKPNK